MNLKFVRYILVGVIALQVATPLYNASEIVTCVVSKNQSVDKEKVKY